MNVVQDKPEVDWIQAKMAYIGNATLSYADIAEMFGISTR